MELEIKDMKYGLIALDSREMEANPEGNAVILHFCGFGKPITQEVVDTFINELSETPEFGLSDIMEHIVVYEAPESIVNQYREDLLNGTIKATSYGDGNSSIGTDTDPGC